ncbi:uncharacterized protein [Drosophila pseudoobscura]|uniref:Uncharacterized protein isoform X1 n=1 Tax=Drosophila pseudoobscura pseudoobscura TaxID=46245 RepID=A0A6I8WAY0_DROPS|nr:uncharacterized protein LOC6901302 isoform X1 [Drosophila pseudoobscura]XP_033240427.1 uncharacterized protein LOC6901302 isoform X1 [Drosophila pseudoobscura]
MNWKKIPVDDTVESFDSITTIQFFGENKKSTKILVKPKPRSEVSDKSDKLETAKKLPRSEVSDKSDKLETAKKLPRSEMTDNLETAKKLPRSEMTDNLETAKELPGSEMSDNLETAKESLHDAVDLQKPIQK